MAPFKMANKANLCNSFWITGITSINFFFFFILIILLIPLSKWNWNAIVNVLCLISMLGIMSSPTFISDQATGRLRTMWSMLMKAMVKKKMSTARRFAELAAATTAPANSGLDAMFARGGFTVSVWRSRQRKPRA